MELKSFFNLSKTFELIKKIDKQSLRLQQRDESEGLNLMANEADELAETLKLCKRLASYAPLVSNYYDLAINNVEARRVYRKNGPRAAARVMGWSKGVRGPSHDLGDSSKDFDELLLYEYLDMIDSEEYDKKGINKKDAVKQLKDKYFPLIKTERAVYERLKRARNTIIEQLENGDLDPDHLEHIRKRFKGILPAVEYLSDEPIP
jgi:hypothetical protein